MTMQAISRYRRRRVHRVGAGAPPHRRQRMRSARRQAHLCGHLDFLACVAKEPRYRFVQGDICDAPAVRAIIEHFAPDIVMHLAAESHVDRSIDGPGDFIQTNVVGTFAMLQAALRYWRALPADRRRFPLSSYLDRRGVRLAGRRWAVLRDHALSRRTRPIRPRRPAPIISSAPGVIPMACRCLSPIARTITGRIISPKS